MANTINVTYKVNEDGSLEKISQNANRAAAATHKVTASTDRYSKKIKGVAGATSNSTKAFSKMTTGITSGLVPAYATLAANVFALTALGVVTGYCRHRGVPKVQIEMASGVVPLPASLLSLAAVQHPIPAA